MKSHRLPRVATAVVACALLAVLVLAPRTAVAQGTNGALPDPISSRELLTYAERLRLSPAQRAAIESIHDDYRVEFRVLREGEIADVLGRMDAFSGSMPRRADVEPLIKDLERLSARIRAIDERFFDRTGPILSEEQLVSLPRIRLARERRRYQTVQTTGMIQQAGRMPVELGTILARIDLSPEARANADPALEGFEMRLTRALREVDESVMGFMLDAITQFEEAGLGDFDMESMANMTPEEMQRFQETMQTVWTSLMARITEKASALAEIDDRGFRSVFGALPDEAARDFKAEYYAEAFPDSAFTRPQIDRGRLERSLTSDDVTEEHRQALRALYEEYRRRLDGITDDTVTTIKESKPNPMAQMNWDGSGDTEPWAEYQRKIEALQKKVAELTEEIVTRGRELVGTELYDKIAHRAAKGDDAEAEAEVAVPAVVPDADDMMAMQATVDIFVAHRISRADVARYAERLGGTNADSDSTRDLLNAVHIDYVERFDGLDAVKKLREASQGLWKMQDGEAVAPTTEDVDDLARLRRAAIDAVIAVDDTFFDEAKLFVDASKHPVVEALRRERRRQVYRPPYAMHSYGFGGESSAGSVDLVEIVDGVRLPAAERTQLDGILDEYSDRTTPVLRDRLMAQIDLQNAMDRMNTRSQAEGAEEGMAQWQAYTKAMAEPSARVSALVEAIEKENRATADRLAAALGGESSSRVRDAFRRSAYPQVYNDELAVHEHLTRALALDDLTPAQREQLTELALAYRPRYEELSEGMIKAASPRMDFAAFEPDDWAEFQRLQRDRERLAYDRNELSFRAIGRLRSILGEAQIGRIGGLPDVDELFPDG